MINCMYCGQYLCEHSDTAFIRCGKCGNINIIDDVEVMCDEFEAEGAEKA